MTDTLASLAIVSAALCAVALVPALLGQVRRYRRLRALHPAVSRRNAWLLAVYYHDL